MVAARHAGAILSIDLDAVAANYALLRDKSPTAICASVVKSDAYGLGLAPVSKRLAHEGCRHFFVAQLGEAISLRKILSSGSADIAIYVLNGPEPKTEKDFEKFGIIPVLNSLQQIDLWTTHAKQQDVAQPALLHIDTGMARLGLTPGDVDKLVANPSLLDGIDVRLVISHLACAEQRENPMSMQQKRLFDDLRGHLPAAPSSLANSSGVFLGPAFHYDLVRPGASLYGVSPVTDELNPMAQVVNLKGKILQVRVIDTDMTVGYGATHRVTRPSRIATVAVGYGDGYPRQLSNRGHGFIDGAILPVVGRVSMDLITFDVSDVPEHVAQPGMMVDLLNDRQTVDDVARESDTIGYEILTRLGARYHRQYKGAVNE